MHWLRRWWEDAKRKPDTRYVDVCDGIRVMAIGVVAWFHIWQQSWLWPILHIGDHQINFDPIVRAGYLGVDIMILISGFCLYLPWAKLKPNEPAPNAMAFYKRRAARILPSYYLSVLVLFALALIEGAYGGNTQRLARDLFSHLTLTHVFFYDTYYATFLNAGLWTIAIEVHFYLLFPWIARLFRRSPFVTAFGMIAIALVFRRWVQMNISDVGVYFNQLIAYLDVFAIGMLAAEIHVKCAHYERSTAWRLVSDALAILSIWGLVRLFRGQASCSGTEAIRLGQMERRLWIALLGAGFLLGAANGGYLLRKLLGNPFTHYFASISMQFYIWHQVLAVRILNAGLISSVYADPNYMGDIVWQRRYTLTCWLIALAVASLLTYGFERPIAKYILNGKTKRNEQPEKRGENRV